LINRVRIARAESSMTQLELAKKIGVTRQTISLIEKGKYNPTLKLCLAICYALNKSLDELFWVEEEEKQ
jgi:Predicted transcriptional regulators